VIRNKRLLYIPGCLKFVNLEDGLACPKYVGKNLKNVALYFIIY
jgi:hypothetical protein